MAVLCTADLAVTDFMAMMADHPFPTTAFLIAFSPAEARLSLFQFDETFFSKTVQGRIFAPDGEFQWRRIDGLMRAVYLGEGPALANFKDNSSELIKLKPQYPECFLWGRYYDPTGEWIEQQVPHRFKYPVAGNRFTNGRVVLITEAWADFAGMVRFQRYHSLKETPGE